MRSYRIVAEVTFNRQAHEMAKLTQAIRPLYCQRIVWVCLTILWGRRLKSWPGNIDFKPLIQKLILFRVG